MAGGLREYANSKKIVIMRTENGRQISLPFNYKDVDVRQEAETEHRAQARRHGGRPVMTASFAIASVRRRGWRWRCRCRPRLPRKPRRSPFAELFGARRRALAGATGSSCGRDWRPVRLARSRMGRRSSADSTADAARRLAGGADARLSVRAPCATALRLARHGRGTPTRSFRRRRAFGAPGYDAGGRCDLRSTTRLVIEARGASARSPFFQLTLATPRQAGLMSLPGIARPRCLLPRQRHRRGCRSASRQQFYAAVERRRHG